MSSAQSASERRSALTSEEWERRLVTHYLRSDGPLGSGTLKFLDATPAEIATASKIDGIAEGEAQQEFLNQFGRRTVEEWLSGGYRPPVVDGDSRAPQ